MKTVTWLTAVVAMLLAVNAGIADANAETITLKTGKFSQSTGVGRAGEFRVTAYSGSYIAPAAKVTQFDSDALFKTFCVERTEYVNGATHAFLNTKALYGSQGPTGDPLDATTAALFYAFWTGSLTGYNYDDVSGTRGVDAEDLQLAIWFLEDEITQAQLNTNNNGKADDFVTFANNSGWDDTGSVYVLNTYDAAGNRKQDQLIVVPVPAAGLLGLLTICGMGIVAVRRRRRRA